MSQKTQLGKIAEKGLHSLTFLCISNPHFIFVSQLSISNPNVKYGTQIQISVPNHKSESAVQI